MYWSSGCGLIGNNADPPFQRNSCRGELSCGSQPTAPAKVGVKQLFTAATLSGWLACCRRSDNRKRREGKKERAGESGEAPPITFLPLTCFNFFRAPFYFAQLPTIWTPGICCRVIWWRDCERSWPGLAAVLASTCVTYHQVSLREMCFNAIALSFQ